MRASGNPDKRKYLIDRSRIKRRGERHNKFEIWHSLSYNRALVQFIFSR